MDTCRFQVFDAEGTNPRLRWFTADGAVVERRLDRAEMDVLIADAERDYQALAFDLPGMGSALYRWLDGPTERWLQAARGRQQPIVLHVDGQERLRGLPWELIFDEGFLSVHPARPVMPVRTASHRTAAARTAANRPLRVMFMASSPEGVAPVLDFEREESEILAAAPGRAEVIVEESGSIRGLADRLSWFGPGFFDVLHLSGHGIVGPSGPRFVMEDDDGRRCDVSADEIAAAVGGNWPRLVFVSGCSTGQAPGAGVVASMAESLVDAGAPAVLGWALPVADLSANQLAAALYQRLSGGDGIVEAVTGARRSLFEAQSRHWHLLRLYTDRSGLEPMVTPLGTRGRVRLRTRDTSTLFLDAEGRVKVPDRAGFVGRRRDLQRLLRALRPNDPADGPQLALLTGMGGMGKSSLTARLLERARTTHEQHAVWVGKVDAISVQNLTQRLTLSDPDIDRRVNELLGRDLPLRDRLRFVLDGPLADIPCMFVFDDFEDGNLEPDGQGGRRCTAEALEVIEAFGTAIARTGSPSRVVITSRYGFPLPASLRVVRQQVGQLAGADLEKKLRLTTNLGPTSTVDPSVRERAVIAAAGIPRLLERMDSLLGATAGNLDALLAEIEQTQLDFREELLLRQLLTEQPTEVRRAIALAAVYEMAVPVEAVLALNPGKSIAAEIEAATQAGLLQAGIHPTNGETRYLVSPLLIPLIDQLSEQLSPSALRLAQERAAEFLYQLWVKPDGQ